MDPAWHKLVDAAEWLVFDFKLSPIKAMYASTYQATSGAGAAGAAETK